MKRLSFGTLYLSVFLGCLLTLGCGAKQESIVVEPSMTQEEQERYNAEYEESMK
jgi:hypothetical protein